MKYLITLLSVLFASSLFGQLKVVDGSTGNTQQSNITIETPSFKKTGTLATTKTFDISPISSVTLDNYVSKKMEVAPALSIQGKLKHRSTKSSHATASDLLMEHKKRISSDSDISHRLIHSSKDDLGMEHFKYAHTYKGLDILHKEVIVHLSDDGYFINGNTVSQGKDISITPSIASEKALDISRKALGQIEAIPQHLDIFKAMKDEQKLVVYIDTNGEKKLAYHHMMFKNIAERYEIVMDAHTGEILRKNLAMCRFHNLDTGDHMHHSCGHHHTHSCSAPKSSKEASPLNGPVVSQARDLFGRQVKLNTYQSSGTYFMLDAARSMYDNANSSMPNSPVGSIWTIDAQNNNPQSGNFSYDHVKSGDINFSGKEIAVSAHHNGGLAYEYFKNVHGRESINGNGGNIISFINVSDRNGNSMGNAFWNGVALFYGSGDNAFQPLARGLDVAGHEMAHGVIQSTANLTYYGESGALNESFADIFGVMIDRDDWLVGEDVVRKSAFPSGALRSMSNPHNGAQTGQFNKGWQPKFYNERYQGSEDNAGVHINSGIPNYVFYLFASNNKVGKEKAEKVYYRALTKYLTKSSQFADARVAVVKAAKDLYGDAVANEATKAFDAVGIPGGSGNTGGGYQDDIEVNPGSDFILFTQENGNGLYVSNLNGELIFPQLTEDVVISVPSISDDGTEIVYVNEQKELKYLLLNWETKKAQSATLNNSTKWRGAAFSKDGLRIAAVKANLVPEVFVYDFTIEAGKTFTLYNPTYTEGVQTGEVLYCDALEFDFTGEQIMYDALNKISGNNSNVEYWDIGFIKVFNNSAKNFESTGVVSKLFNNLSNGISVGNPTFSKNSPYIIAFDYVNKNDFVVLGANIETNTVKTIFDTDKMNPSYPSYATKDNALIFNYNLDNKGIIAGVNLAQSKIEPNGDAGQVLNFNVGVKWGKWFSNGKRDVVSTANPIADGIKIYPIPAQHTLKIDNSIEGGLDYVVSLLDGREIKRGHIAYGKNSISTENLANGMYVLSLRNEKTTYSRLITIQK